MTKYIKKYLKNIKICKGHLPSASIGEFLGEVIFVFLVKNMMNRSKICFGKTRPTLKQLRKNKKKICNVVQSETQDELSKQHTNLSRDALRG